MNGNRQDPKRKKIWTALFVLINIAVVAATAVNEFSGNTGGSAELRFTPRALFFLGFAVLFGPFEQSCDISVKPLFQITHETAPLRMPAETKALHLSRLYV